MSKQLGFLLSLSLLFVVLSVFVGAVKAQSTDLPPLTEPGPYGVRLKILHLVDPSRENWTLDTLVWYPADKTDATPVRRGSLNLRDALPDRSGAPYPLIIFSHGWLETSSQLSQVMEHLASQGYVVAAPTHHDTTPLKFELVDRPLDIMLVLDQLAAITDGDLAGMIDTNNVGLMGYSAGGGAVLEMLGLARDPTYYVAWCAQHLELKTWDCNPPAWVGHWDFDAIAEYRAQLGLQALPDGTWAPFGDERIHAVLALAPLGVALTTEEMQAAVTTPTMILMGTRDELLDYEGNAVRTYTYLGTDDRYLITLVGGTHMFYPAHQEVPLHFAVAFFGDYLKGDNTYAPYLTAEHLPTFRSITLAWGPYAGE